MAFHAEEFAQNFGQRVRRIRKEERLTSWNFPIWWV